MFVCQPSSTCFKTSCNDIEPEDVFCLRGTLVSGLAFTNDCLGPNGNWMSKGTQFSQRYIVLRYVPTVTS
jgi:hypothetical protein